MSVERPPWIGPGYLNDGKSFEEMIDDFEDSPVNTETWVTPAPTGLAELANWWSNLGCRDSELVIKKYQEYGNTALLEVGGQLADVLGWENATVAQKQELGIWFFMVGKMARWKTAIFKGEQVSKDTLDDLAVYATMARRVHAKGGWPGV